MLESFLVVLNSVITLFLMMAVGFYFARRGWLTEETSSQLSRLLLYVVTPCILVDLFLVERTDEIDGRMLSAALALALSYGLYMLLCPLLFRREGEDDRGVLRFASIYGNKGFMGLPLIQAALGGEAAMTAAFALGWFNVISWTHGYMVIGGKGLSLKKAFLNPAVLGFAAAIVFYLTGFRLPGAVNEAVGFLGSLNTPLAMFIIGGQMGRADLRTALSDRRVYAASALKLAVMPAVTMLVLLPLRLDEVTYMTLAILSGCPTAGITSLFSQMLGKDTSLAARQVTLSTLLCILTLPLVALCARYLIS